jgi:hypothetical protein
VDRSWNELEKSGKLENGTRRKIERGSGNTELGDHALKSKSHCKMTDYKYENYRTQFLTKENKLIMPVQVREEWIKDSDPKESLIHDRLKALLRNLRNY